MNEDKKEILKNIDFLIQEDGRVLLNRESFDYLFEQAEQTEKLKRHDDLHRAQVNYLQEKNRRYREAIDKAIESYCYNAAVTDLRKFIEGEDGWKKYLPSAK